MGRERAGKRERGDADRYCFVVGGMWNQAGEGNRG